MHEHEHSGALSPTCPLVIVDPEAVYKVTHPDGPVGVTDGRGNRIAYMDPNIFPGLLDVEVVATEIPYDELKK